MEESLLIVDDALTIGERMSGNFMAYLPQGFQLLLKKKVTTMEVAEKGLKIKDFFEYDMEPLYARLLILSKRRDISLSELFPNELLPVPLALFD